MICIYAIENKINGKKYIGQTVDFRHRKTEHFTRLRTQKHHSMKLQRSFNKYGENNFSTHILLECNSNELNSFEKYYIWLYNSYHNGYNHNLGSNDRSNFGVEFYYKGKKYKNIKKTAIEMGLHPKQLHARVRYGRKEKGWNLRKCEWNGKKYSSVNEAAKDNNVKQATMKARLDKGYTSDTDLKHMIITKDIVINGIKYKTFAQASKELNVPQTTLHRWFVNDEMWRLHK